MKRDYYFTSYTFWQEVMALVGVIMVMVAAWLFVVAFTPGGR